VLFDLLDDWSIHPAFRVIRPDIERAYAEWFDIAAIVTANSEGTLALAHRHGRSDAIMLPNGCDPDRFSSAYRPSARFTVGYGGKIGHRLDFDLIEACCRMLPDVQFEFAGPLLARGYGKRLRSLPNIKLLGDVRYDRYPGAFARWDIAWVPHSVGANEVGGDAIKLYEYRAAGLPVLTTKIVGWQRAPEGVRALERDEVPSALASLASRGPGSTIRDRYITPRENTWQFKAEYLLERLGLAHDTDIEAELREPAAP
jgi:glycosyltransferase involved in cell wall biosynthesis